MNKGNIKLVKDILSCIKGAEKKFLVVEATSKDTDRLPCSLAGNFCPGQELTPEGTYACKRHEPKQVCNPAEIKARITYFHTESSTGQKVLI